MTLVVTANTAGVKFITMFTSLAHRRSYGTGLAIMKWQLYQAYRFSATGLQSSSIT